MVLTRLVTVGQFSFFLLFYLFFCQFGCSWQMIDQSELQLNLLAQTDALPSFTSHVVPILTEFEQLQEAEDETNSSSDQAASVCANGVCTIY